MREGKKKFGNQSCTSEYSRGDSPFKALLIFYQWAGVLSASPICQAPLLCLCHVATSVAGSLLSPALNLLTSARPCLVSHATAVVADGGARPVQCPFCGWVYTYSMGTALINREYTNQNSQVRVGCNSVERAIGKGCLGGLWQSATHKGHSKHVWSCLVKNYSSSTFFGAIVSHRISPLYL